MPIELPVYDQYGTLQSLTGLTTRNEEAAPGFSLIEGSWFPSLDQGTRIIGQQIQRHTVDYTFGGTVELVTTYSLNIGGYVQVTERWVRSSTSCYMLTLTITNQSGKSINGFKYVYPSFNIAPLPIDCFVSNAIVDNFQNHGVNTFYPNDFLRVPTVKLGEWHAGSLYNDAPYLFWMRNDTPGVYPHQLWYFDAVKLPPRKEVTRSLMLNHREPGQSVYEGFSWLSPSSYRTYNLTQSVSLDRPILTTHRCNESGWHNPNLTFDDLEKVDGMAYYYIPLMLEGNFQGCIDWVYGWPLDQPAGEYMHDPMTINREGALHWKGKLELAGLKSGQLFRLDELPGIGEYFADPTVENYLSKLWTLPIPRNTISYIDSFGKSWEHILLLQRGMLNHAYPIIEHGSVDTIQYAPTFGRLTSAGSIYPFGDYQWNYMKHFYPGAEFWITHDEALGTTPMNLREWSRPSNCGVLVHDFWLGEYVNGY